MSTCQVRLFRRDDRDQLTALVNAHVQAVIPGHVVSVNTVLSHIERDPAEFIVDTWVARRVTLVAEQRSRVAAAAHLLLFRDDSDVGESYCGIGEVRWLLAWPDAPFWPDSGEAGDAVTAAAVETLGRLGAARISADGALPAPGVYGVPEQWPHVRAILKRGGFLAGAATESVYLAEVDALARPAPAGLTMARTVGINGTRFTAVRGDRVVGHIEVGLCAGDAVRVVRGGGWADIGNLYVDPADRRQGIATELLGAAAEWLRLGHIDRLLAYSGDEPAEEGGGQAFLRAVGFRRLTTTIRDWSYAGSDMSLAARPDSHRP